MSRELGGAVICFSILVGIFFGGIWVGRGTKQAEFDADALSKKQGEEATLKAVALAISKIGTKSEKHLQPILTEVRTNTVYRSVGCQHSDDSLLHLNTLITGDEPEPGGGGLPESKQAD